MSLADVLGPATLKSESVSVNGREVTVRELNAGERGEVIRLFKDAKNIAEIHARIVVMAAQRDGQPAFKEKDVPELLKYPGGIIQKLADKALELSAMGGDDEKKE
jgi:hypothetical protein